MVNVLATEPNARTSNQAVGDGSLRSIKIRGMPSFGGEVKQSAPRRKT
jgi:hypothetical protein